MGVSPGCHWALAPVAGGGTDANAFRLIKMTARLARDDQQTLANASGYGVANHGTECRATLECRTAL